MCDSDGQKQTPTHFVPESIHKSVNEPPRDAKELLRHFPCLVKQEYKRVGEHKLLQTLNNSSVAEYYALQASASQLTFHVKRKTIIFLNKEGYRHPKVAAEQLSVRDDVVDFV